MLGRVTAIQEDKLAVFVQFDSPVEFRMGDLVQITKHRKTRSLEQNRLYWSFLQWCIKREGGGLIDQGHWSADGLHSDIKAWIQDKYPHQFDFQKVFSTAELDTKQFTQFLEIVDHELMIEFFGIDTSPFWDEVKKEEALPFEKKGLQ